VSLGERTSDRSSTGKKCRPRISGQFASHTLIALVRFPSRALRTRVPPRPRITARCGTSRRVRIPLRRSGTSGVSRSDTGLRGEVKPVTARRSCSLSRTRPRRLQRSGALPEILTPEPRATVRENGHSSPGVLRLYSTCDDRESGSRIDPASPPAGFPFLPPWQLHYSRPYPAWRERF
jgi:hypothetical protein